MEPDKTQEEKKPDTLLPIVGIGASAGGLHALDCFLEALPKDFDFAVVFIQHLSPTHKSLMPEILRQKWRDLEFIEIEDGLQLLPGRIYLCPPAIEVRVQKGVFRIIARPDEHIHFPIDEFLVPLAEDSAERAIAVVFSGAGTDGVRGIQAIRAAGGTVFVQDPATAQFPDLPQAAIKTEKVDSVLPPADIAREIVKLLSSGAMTETPDKLITPADLEPFYLLIREITGLTFNHYKKSVVSRRLRRRMYLHGVMSVSEYLDMIANKDEEAALLASDLMIGVTSFFRDSLAWKSLRTSVIEKLVVQEDDTPLRVWTPACATGEESYSIAMMLRYELDLAGRKRELQVFATDVNDRALEKAREGKYPASISADVPQKFMRKFFTHSDNGVSVTVSKEMRQHVIFAKQDLLIDPPFSRLDLVICRNLLIYLEPEAQEKCITLFHYALKPGGYLFLGNAESPGRKSAFFKSLAHEKCRVYEKIEIEPSSRLPLPVPFAAERATVTSRQQPASDERHSLIQLSQDTLLETHAPAAVTIDQNHEIVYHNGPTKRYLTQPHGAPTQNLLELMPENLRNRIRGAIYKVTREDKPITIRASIVGDEGQKRQVSILVSKIKDNLFLLVFREKAGPPSEALSEALEAICVEEPAMRQLEIELTTTRQELQTNIEQLRSMNEEQQSSNEELQAANEELETSREELQSLNEELITVNTQLQVKVEEQEGTNNDLNNFLGSTNIPTIFLDHHFRVKRYTPAITKLIKLIPSDVGRQIIDMSQEHLGPDLIADAQSVLENLVPVKKEIKINSDWYVRTALPYRTLDNRIEGVVVTYNDVTELKRAEERANHLASFPRLNPNPVIEIDSSGKVAFYNQGALKTLESLDMDKGEVNVFLPPDLGATMLGWDKDKETSFQREIIIKDRIFGETIQLVPQFEVARIYAADITERKRAEEELRKSEERFRLLVAGVKDYAIFMLDPEGRVETWNAGAESMKGYKAEEIIGEHFSKFYTPEDIAGHKPEKELRTAMEIGQFEEEGWRVRKDGSSFWASVLMTALRDDNGTLRGFAKITRDITDRKRAEEALHRQAELLKLSYDAIIVRRLDGGIESWNRGAEQLYGFTENEVLGKITHKVLATTHPKPWDQIEAELLEKSLWEGELRHHTKDGREVIVSARHQLIRGDDGVDVVLETNRDITNRKRAEEEINTLNNDLLERNEQLGVTNKELESFIYSVSHDLRGPLRSISGFSEMVMKNNADKLDDKGKRYLSRIHVGTEKMSRLIDDLLNLSKISRQEIRRKSIDLTHMASSIVTELSEANPGRDVEADIVEGLTAYVDPGLIEIVLSNLLGNAWKFSSKKEQARIEFGTVAQNGKVVYYVRDNGAGFNQEYAQKMFYPFHRLHSEEAFEGTGIGLALVERIINRHGGKVWAEGLEGKGAAIYFSLT